MISIERVVAVLTPAFAAASAWLSGAVARYGINLDKTQTTALMVAGATAALGAAWKWLEGRQKWAALEVELQKVEKAGSLVVNSIDPQLEDQLRQIVATESQKVFANPDLREIASPAPAEAPVSVPAATPAPASAAAVS
jgi:hypothetical protein